MPLLMRHISLTYCHIQTICSILQCSPKCTPAARTDIVWVKWGTVHITIAAIINVDFQILSAGDIFSGYRIIPAVGKHIIAQFALSCSNKSIGVEESAHLWIVITGLQVVQTDFVIVHISTVAQGFCVSPIPLASSFTNP